MSQTVSAQIANAAALGLLGVAALLTPVDLAHADPARAELVTTRISVAADGAQGDADSFGQPAANANGRYVAFLSEASNLVPNDTNGKQDIFRYDTQSTSIELITRGVDDAPANDDSQGPRLSADGRYVVYFSSASNLAAGDTNNLPDVFLYDHQSKQTTRITANEPTGGSTPDISADGRYIAFGSFASFNDQISVYDRQTGKTVLISRSMEGIPSSGTRPRISANGRFVSYMSQASDLVPGDTNGKADVFLYDRFTKTTSRASVGVNGAEPNDDTVAPVISGNGRYVAYSSSASNLVAQDTNGMPHVFLYDHLTKQTSLASVATGGAVADDMSIEPDISADGQLIVFWSWATNFDPGDKNARADVYVHDRSRNQTTRISVPWLSTGSGGGGVPTISADGRIVAFSTRVSDLVDADTNAAADVFVRPHG